MTANTEDLNAPDSSSINNPIVRRAHRRYKKCQEWEMTSRVNWMMDYKFANGDSYNHFQWPANIQEDRGARPCLTVNETRQHNLHIINEAKQNKASVKYRPTGMGASAEGAEVFEGMYRHIANVSNAQMAQGQAIGFQITSGLGFTIIEADYIEASPKPGPESFNQEIYIRGVDDPMSVYLDCDAKEPDGSDARYGFKFTDRPKDDVLEQYPELENRLIIANAVDGQDSGWIRQDHVREALYYEVTEDRDELLGDDQGTTIFASQVPRKLQKQWEEEHEARGTKLKRRPIIRKSVKSHLIIGNDLIKTNDIPGTAVPIIPWMGEVTVIDQVLDRKGHTRSMLSAQQMENYNWSAAVEFGALQSKSPWLASVAAMGDYTTYYQTSNVENHAVLPWVHRDEEGRDIPPPQRMSPPMSAPVYMDGVKMAREFMQASSGQFDAMMGENGNERSGKALNQRQRMGDRATYHFVDAQSLAIRRMGVIIKEWIPIIYDTARAARIIGADGTDQEVQIDPDSPEAHHIKEVGGAIQRMFNPNVGSYEVVSDVGPDYATQQQEAFNAISEVLVRAPALVDKIGDLLFKVGNFPLADEIAERLKPGLDPKAQQAITDLQKQLQKQNTLLGETMQSLTEERLHLKAKDSHSVTDEFRADTERAKMLIDAATKVDPSMAMEMIREMAQAAVQQALQDNLGPVRGAASADLGIEAQGNALPGASGVLPPQSVATGNGPGTPGAP